MKRPSLLLIGGLLALAAFVAFSALFTVHQTQQALILQFGNPVRVEREPGLKVEGAVRAERRVFRKADP